MVILNSFLLGMQGAEEKEGRVPEFIFNGIWFGLEDFYNANLVFAY